MADQFLKALEQTALKIGKNLPKIKTGGFPNIMGAVSQYTGTPNAGPSMSGSVPGLGAITTRPGESTRYERSHPGIDIANKIGTMLPAFMGGRVTDIKTGQKQGDRGYGNYVIITDAEGNKHRYSHLSNSLVKIGDNVRQGQSIGTMGNTGQTYSLSGGTGSHLDYRIMNAYGKYVDPTVFIRPLVGRS